MDLVRLILVGQYQARLVGERFVIDAEKIKRYPIKETERERQLDRSRARA